MQSSEQTAQLYAALAIAQGDLADAAKDSKNPHFNSRYADITSILQAVRPVFSKQGLAIIQGLATAADFTSVTCTTRICHKSGEWIESALTLPILKKDAQGCGIGGTYARRYGLAAMVAIGQDDDDGNSVSLPPKAKAEAPADSPKPKAKKADATPEDVEAMKAEFDLVKTSADLTKLVPAFTKLTPAQQTEVQPHAQAARTRAGL